MGGAQAGEGQQRGRGAHRGLPVLERTTLDEEASGRAPGKLPRLEWGGKSAAKVLGKCWAWASPWAWAMAVAADTTLQLGLRRLDRAAEK